MCVTPTGDLLAESCRWGLGNVHSKTTFSSQQFCNLHTEHLSVIFHSCDTRSFKSSELRREVVEKAKLKTKKDGKS